MTLGIRKKTTRMSINIIVSFNDMISIFTFTHKLSMDDSHK